MNKYTKEQTKAMDFLIESLKKQMNPSRAFLKYFELEWKDLEKYVLSLKENKK